MELQTNYELHIANMITQFQNLRNSCVLSPRDFDEKLKGVSTAILSGDFLDWEEDISLEMYLPDQDIDIVEYLRNASGRGNSMNYGCDEHLKFESADMKIKRKVTLKEFLHNKKKKISSKLLKSKKS